MSKVLLLLTFTFLTGCFDSGGGGSESSGGGLFSNHKPVNNKFVLDVPASKTYTLDEDIDFVLTHSQRIDVTGSPRLSFNLNGNTVYADYLSGNGTRNLTFRYTVQAGDNDSNGIEVNTSIDLNGASLTYAVKGVIDDANLDFDNEDTSGILISTSAPTITSIDVPANNTYVENDNLDFVVHTSEAINVSGTPRIVLDIAGGTYYANYISGSGSETLTFRYTVGASLEDLDGISHSSPIELNGGALTGVGSLDLELTFTPADTTGILIDSIVPIVSSVTPPADSTYQASQDIDFIVNFSEAVNISGTPRLVLDIGGVTKHANYLSGDGSVNITFRYTTEAGLFDTDGIALSSNIDLNGGSLADNAGNYNLDLTANQALPDLTSVLVDSDGPSITSITLPSNNTYTENQNVDFIVNFDEIVNVSGSPRIAITLTSGTVYANYQSGTGSTAITFRYTVADGDYDNDGITLISPLELNSATVLDGTANPADLSFSLPNTSGILIDAQDPTVTITSSPNIILANQSSYSATGTCSEEGRTVTVNIGGNTYTPSCSSNNWDTGSLDVSGLADTTSLTITADHDDAAGNTAPQASASRVKDTDAPDITSNAIAADTYITDEEITLSIQFDQTVVVSGNPRVQITLDTHVSNPIYFSYDSGSTTDTLNFTYTVVDGEEDLDGIDINASIDLNSGSIVDQYLNPAVLTNDSTNFASALVITAVPSVTSFIEPIDGTYADGSDLLFQVNFDEAVTVSGTPRLALDIGGVTRYATYSSGSTTAGLEFSYTIQAGENDADGIEITSDSVDLNGGNIISTSTSSPALVNFAAYKDSTTAVLVDTASGIVAPDQVTNLNTAPSSNDTDLSLTWSVPNDNGTAIINYNVQYREQGESSWLNLSPSPTVNSGTIPGLTSGITYEFRVAANNGLLGPFSAVGSAEIFDLTSLNLALWLDSSDASTLFTDDACSLNVSSDGDGVGCWEDKSGNGQAYIQSSATYKPTYRTSTINGKDGLEFDGGGDFLVDEAGENYINGFDAFEFFVVVKSDITNTDKGILDTKNPNGADDGITLRYDLAGFGGGCSQCLKGGIEVSGGGSAQSETNNNTQTTNTQLLGATWASGGKFDIYVDGSLSQSWDTGTLAGTTANAEKFLIGKGPKDTGTGSSWDGKIVEIVFLNTQTNASDKTKIMDYLKTKWGIP